MARICVFDVNETLLDLKALDTHFERIFGKAAVREEWFNQLLQSAFVSTVLNTYIDFGKIGMAALEMVAEKQNVRLSDGDKEIVKNGMQQLPPHPEVKESLAQLRKAGLRLAALPNSTLKVAQAQLTNAGLSEYFEQILSADTVQRLKPASEPYQMAAKQFGVSVGEVRLIAAHAWDVAGAMRAGCAAAFVARPGKVLNPLAPRPDVVGSDLREVAAQIIEHEVGSRA